MSDTWKQYYCQAWDEEVKAVNAVPAQRTVLDKCPRLIAEQAYQEYAAQGHGGQSFERLHERGGFSWGEIAMLLMDALEREIRDPGSSTNKTIYSLRHVLCAHEQVSKAAEEYLEKVNSGLSPNEIARAHAELRDRLNRLKYYK